jgi:hypothetical protein
VGTVAAYDDVPVLLAGLQRVRARRGKSDRDGKDGHDGDNGSEMHDGGISAFLT